MIREPFEFRIKVILWRPNKTRNKKMGMKDLKEFLSCGRQCDGLRKCLFTGGVFLISLPLPLL